MIKKILSFIILTLMALQIPVYAVEEKPPIEVHIPVTMKEYGGTCALLMDENGTVVDSIDLDANSQGEFVVNLPYEPETYEYTAAVVKTAEGITPDSNTYTVTIFVASNDFNEDLQYSVAVVRPSGIKPDKISFTNKRTSGSPKEPDNPNPNPGNNPNPNPSPDPGKTTPSTDPNNPGTTPGTNTTTIPDGTVKGINRQSVPAGTQSGTSAADDGGLLGTRKAIATGDDANLTLYLTLCAASGAALLVIFISKRRKYYEK